MQRAWYQWTHRARAAVLMHNNNDRPWSSYTRLLCDVFCIPHEKLCYCIQNNGALILGKQNKSIIANEWIEIRTVCFNSTNEAAINKQIWNKNVVTFSYSKLEYTVLSEPGGRKKRVLRTTQGVAMGSASNTCAQPVHKGLNTASNEPRTHGNAK